MGIIEKVRSIRDKRVPRTVAVKAAANLTPNMRRVTLHGDALENFPPGAEGTYIKMLFEQAGGAKPAMRTYTVAAQRPAQNEIDVDFMLHGASAISAHADNNGAAHGIAAPWSLSAQPGDAISFFGPGPAKFINTDATCFLLAADMTALPALTANLKLLPEHARGQVFIEIMSEADKQDLVKPAGVELVWVVNDDPGSDTSPLFHALQQAEWQEGKLAAWVACEFKTMRKIRQYLKVERNIEKSHLYISSYWKRGDAEEAHKVAKRADADQNDM